MNKNKTLTFSLPSTYIQKPKFPPFPRFLLFAFHRETLTPYPPLPPTPFTPTPPPPHPLRTLLFNNPKILSSKGISFDYKTREKMTGSSASTGGAAPPTAQSSSAVVNGGGRSQISHPIKRYLPFASMRPPFVTPEDYHRFSIPGVDSRIGSASLQPEAIVVKSPVSLLDSCLSY